MLDNSPSYANSNAWQDMINKKRIMKEMSFARGSTQSPKIMSTTFFNNKSPNQTKFSKSKMTNGETTRTTSTQFMTHNDSKNMTHTSVGIFGKTAGTMLNTDVRKKVTNWASNQPSLTARDPQPASMEIRETNLKSLNKFPSLNAPEPSQSPSKFDGTE